MSSPAVLRKLLVGAAAISLVLGTAVASTLPAAADQGPAGSPWSGTVTMSRPLDSTVNLGLCGRDDNEAYVLTVTGSEAWTVSFADVEQETDAAIITGHLQFTEKNTCGTSLADELDANYSGTGNVHVHVSDQGNGAIALSEDPDGAAGEGIPGEETETHPVSDADGNVTGYTTTTVDQANLAREFVTAALTPTAQGVVQSSAPFSNTGYETTPGGTPEYEYDPRVTASSEDLSPDKPLSVKVSASDAPFCSTTFHYHFSQAEQATFTADNNGPDTYCGWYWAVGQASSCPTDLSAYHADDRVFPAVAFPDDGFHPVTLCAESLVSSPGTVSGPTVLSVASPVFLYAPIVYLAKGEKDKPDSTVDFLKHAKLILDGPDGLISSETVGGVAKGLVTAEDSSCANQTVIPTPKAKVPPNGHPVVLGNGAVLKRLVLHPLVTKVVNHKIHCTYNSHKSSTKVAKTSATGAGLVLQRDNTIRRGEPTKQTPRLSLVPVYTIYKADSFIAYWFFYPGNDYIHTFHTPVGSKTVVELHQGDWEHIVVDLRHNPALIAGQSAREVDYYQHYCGAERHVATTTQGPIPTGAVQHLVSLDGKFSVQEDTHPVVYSALGGHASYPTAGSGKGAACWKETLAHAAKKLNFSDLKLIAAGVGDSTSKGTRWATYDSLDNMTTQPWWGFTGNWGITGFGTGPKGAKDVSPAAGPVSPNPTHER